MSLAVECDGQVFQADPGRTLWDVLSAGGAHIPSSCSREGKCGECAVEILEGETLLSVPSSNGSPAKGKHRLACLTRVVGVQGTVRCKIPVRPAMQIQTQACDLPVSPWPVPRHPTVTRAGSRVLLDGDEIATAPGPLHGLAIDLGTSTVVVRLLDLESGAIRSTQAFENPQRFAGPDVMSRIRWAAEKGLKVLQRVLIEALCEAIRRLPADPLTIYEVVVAGNPTMRDLFFGLDVSALGKLPFRSVTEEEALHGQRAGTSHSCRTEALGLPVHPNARVYGLPLIGSHVGADTAACILAIGLLEEERIVALMDIGSNTEILVGNRHRALVASCPAGPAFEGGQIRWGMPALAGAIERVRILDDGSVLKKVIGGGKPEGICGSGLVDVLSELLRTGHMDARGHPTGGQRLAVDLDGEINLSWEDVALLAQAKGANVAGLQTVLEEFGLGSDQIERLYLAGGFARHVDVEAARRIGLVPCVPNKAIRQVGNAAIEGATMALLSKTQRRSLEAFVRTIQHVRLETHGHFLDRFAEGCRFSPVTAG